MSPALRDISRRRSNLVARAALTELYVMNRAHQDLCGPRGRAWLAEQVVPEDERLAIERHLREFDRLGEDLKVIERDLDEAVRWSDKGAAHAYNIKSHRDEERRWGAYARFVAGWTPRGPKVRTGVAKEERR